MNKIKKEIEILLEKYNGRVESVVTSLRFNPTLKERILSSTTFLPTKANLSNRVYHLYNQLTTIPTCRSCGNAVSFWNFREGYRIFCKNVKCSGNDETVKNKRKKTNKELFGVENVFSSKGIQEKIKRHNIDTHGVVYVGQRADVRKKVEETNLRKYGVKSTTQVPEIKAKQVKTLQKNYGVSVPLKSHILKERSKNTCQEKYGNNSTAEVSWIRDKQRETLQQNYGVTTPFASTEIREKARKTIEENFDGSHPMQTNGIQNKVKATCQRRFNADSPLGSATVHAATVASRNKNFHQLLLSSDRLKGLVVPLFSEEEYSGVYEAYKWQCIECANIFEAKIHEGKTPRCKVCFPITSSSYELEIKEWLESFGVIVETSDRVILKPMEIDLYLPEHKLAIEFNGLYWHGESVSKYKCNQAYHLKKTKLCEEQHISLLHIFEDEWVDKKEVVKSIILNKLGLVTQRLYARKCKIKAIDFATLTEFLENNHLQGPSDSSKYRYGLFYEKELVYVISLSKPRFTKKYEYELIRSCGKINTSIIGGFNKLVKYAIRDLHISSVISYVDRRYFNGSGYKDWKYTGASRPNYFYVDTSKLQRESRLKFQKKSIKKNFPDVYDEQLTEWQLMQLLGYDRIWDCGHLTFEWRGEK